MSCPKCEKVKWFKTARERLNYLGQALTTYREEGDTTIIVGFTQFPPEPDCEVPHYSVTVRDGVREATGSAVGFYDAWYMARAKLKDRIAESKIEAIECSFNPEVPAVPKLRIDPTKLKVPGQ